MEAAVGAVVAVVDVAAVLWAAEAIRHVARASTPLRTRPAIFPTPTPPSPALLDSRRDTRRKRAPIIRWRSTASGRICLRPAPISSQRRANTAGATREPKVSAAKAVARAAATSAEAVEKDGKDGAATIATSVRHGHPGASLPRVI